MALSEVFGFLGATIVVLAYVPQIHHMVREHCSGGISAMAWALWLIASILVLSHAITTKDSVFISLQAVNTLATAIILFLIKSYQGKTCHLSQHTH